MAKRPKPTSTIIASGHPTGGDVMRGRGRSSQKKRKETELCVETQFDGRFPVSPREIDLINHYLGQMIDALLRGEE